MGSGCNWLRVVSSVAFALTSAAAVLVNKVLHCVMACWRPHVQCLALYSESLIVSVRIFL
jgi:hypothetical protein